MKRRSGSRLDFPEDTESSSSSEMGDIPVTPLGAGKVDQDGGAETDRGGAHWVRVPGGNPVVDRGGSR